MTEPITTADDLLSAAARAYPKKTAIRADYGDISYAEIDRAATMCAAALRGLLGEERSVVAVASPLHPDFMVGFYGAIRSGNIAAPINPMLPPHLLEHMLATSGARLVFVTTELFAVLRRVRHRLPDLREAVLVGPGPVTDANDIRTIDDLSAAYEVRGNAMSAPPKGTADDVACVHFTSGTTGLPRGVRLTHRNLTVNAEQTALAHRLGPDSVVLNHLPKFHLMHLNAVVHAGGTQVPCISPENRAAIETANASGATHFYTIPMRLNQLAADPELPTLKLDTVGMIASGGSALSARVGQRLSEHFTVPVFQGYGLAETSPLTHSAGPDDPRPGSVGPVVRDTECRVVDLTTGEDVPAGERGEILVRGPQVMRGYLDPDEPTGIDSDGWLATGDIGYQDQDGFLYVVDRIKDLFKCDNYLVAPTEIETVLETHPRVRDCAVVDYPDPVSGAVANAFVALEETDTTSTTAITDFLKDRLPYYQQVRHLEVVDTVPRSPNGKAQRRELRAELITRRELTGPGTESAPGVLDLSRDLSRLITVIARFTTKGDPQDFEKFFLDHVEFMKRQSGFAAQQALVLADDPGCYLNFGWWLDQQAFQRVVQGSEFRAHQATMRSMLEDAALDVCKSLYRVTPVSSTPGITPDSALQTVTTFQLTASAEEFERAFVDYARGLRTLDGFGYADLGRSVQDPGRYTAIAYWRDRAAWEAATGGADHRALEGFAEVRTEHVRHVAWNRAVE